MTGEVTFLKLVFPFQTHTLNVRAWYEINSSEAELATPKEHSYSKLNVAWTDIFCICFVNCLCLVLLPLFGGTGNLCSERTHNRKSREVTVCGETTQSMCVAAMCIVLWSLPKDFPTCDYKSEPVTLCYSTLNGQPCTLKRNGRSFGGNWGKSNW